MVFHRHFQSRGPQFHTDLNYCLLNYKQSLPLYSGCSNCKHQGHKSVLNGSFFVLLFAVISATSAFSSVRVLEHFFNTKGFKYRDLMAAPLEKVFRLTLHPVHSNFSSLPSLLIKLMFGLDSFILPGNEASALLCFQAFLTLQT